MRGLVPNVKTFSFLTASNPLGVEADAKTNNAANKKLEEKLRSMNLGFTKVQGKYGVEEESFFIPNITKSEALNLGKLFSQESIIFGEKNDKDNYDGVVFKMIFTDDRFGEIVGERNVYINKNDDDDYYTSVKGRKFQIPFSSARPTSLPPSTPHRPERLWALTWRAGSASSLCMTLSWRNNPSCWTESKTQ